MHSYAHERDHWLNARVAVYSYTYKSAFIEENSNNDSYNYYGQ